nr:uncharacterized protein LOC117855534 isoform X2 [Setaria viridis]
MTVGAPGWAEHACFVSLLLVGHQEQIKSMEYYPVESSLMCSAISSFNLPSQAHWYGRTALKQGMRCEFDDNWQFKARMKLFA